MADFKLKPGAGTGNKLILESQDGTDVLTTSDSGVTITAPTIADLSNVTGTLPVGVIGGSGLTALGTVTAGNLSNTAIVYPTGHVIKVGSANLSADVTTSGTGYVDCFAPTFTPDGGPNNTSTIYAYLHLQININYGSSLSGLERIRYQISGDDISDITGLDGEFFGSYYTGNTADWWDQSVTTLMLAPRTLDGTGNATITYDIDIGEASTSSSMTIYGNNTSAETHIQFWEVI